MPTFRKHGVGKDMFCLMLKQIDITEFQHKSCINGKTNELCVHLFMEGLRTKSQPQTLDRDSSVLLEYVILMYN